MKTSIRKNKKAYARTLEAVIAFFVTFIFVLVLILHTQSVQPKLNSIDVLSTLEFDDDFRNCVYDYNFSCMDAKIEERMPAKYDFTIKVNDLGALPYEEKEIFVESLFMTADEAGEYRIVKLHYWYK